MKSAHISGDNPSSSSGFLPPKVAQNRKAVDFWMMKKTMHSTAVECIRQLSRNRAKSEKDMKEVAVAIYAVEHLFKEQGLFHIDKSDVEAYLALEKGGRSGIEGDENIKSSNNTKEVNNHNGSSSSGRKSEDELLKELTDKRKEELSMFPHFSKWIREHKFTFSNVQLSAADLQGVQVRDQVYKLLKLDLLQKDDNGDSTILESLPYVTIRQDDKKKADKTTVVTNKLNPNDQFCNYIYMRELKKVWAGAKKELQTRLTQAIADKKEANQSKKGRDRDRGTSSDNSNEKEVSEINILKSLGIMKLKAWIDEDEKDEKIEKERDEHEKRVENSNQFASYLHKAVYGGKEDKGHGGAGAKDDKDDDSRYAEGPIDDDEPKSKKGKDKNGRGKGNDDRAFSEWIMLKDLRDQAIACLSNIDNPVVVARGGGLPTSSSSSLSRTSRDGNLVGAAALSSSNMRKSADKEALVNLFQSLGEIDRNLIKMRAILVGKNLKKVDRTLFSEWIKWLGDYEMFAYRGGGSSVDGADTVRFAVDSRTIAGYLWDSFEPVSCDLHSPTMSQIKDSFMKILRPDIDFEETFVEFKKKQKGRKRDAQFLNKDEMRDILETMKVTMKETDVLALIDAFDSEGKGVVSKTDFINFAAPIKSKKCCWRTTCRVTGMCNAYSVSMLQNVRPVIKGPPISEEDNYDDDSKSSAAELIKEDFKSTRVVASTERKIIRELPERRKREIVLKDIYSSLGEKSFIADAKTLSRVGADKKKDKKEEGSSTSANYSSNAGSSNNDDENYEDDFDNSDPKTKADSKDSNGGAADRGSETCAFSIWNSEQREKGLSVLLNLSAGNKKQELLAKALVAGQPPSAPKVWFDLNDKVGKMTLRWGPENNDDNNVIISFYSIEFGGSVASKTNVFEEIFNDPPTLGDKFENKFVVQGLKPGTKYVFRVRAYSGFGPSNYTYVTGLTVDSKPPRPRIYKLSGQSVSLNWESGQMGVAGGGIVDSSIKYVVESCLNEIEESWVPVTETSRCRATLSRLAPGTSYRFRVISKAADGVTTLCSQPSDDIVVHTCLDTPVSLVQTSVEKTRICLAWKEGDKAINDVNSKISQWSGLVDKELCISLEYLFSKYDPEGKGILPRRDLVDFLSELGAEPTDDRMTRILIDCNSSNSSSRKSSNRDIDDKDKVSASIDIGDIDSISLEKFAKWWYDDDNLVYCVYKSDPVPLSSLAPVNESMASTTTGLGGVKQTAADLLKLKDVTSSAFIGANVNTKSKKARPKSASAAASSSSSSSSTSKKGPGNTSNVVPKKAFVSPPSATIKDDKEAATPRSTSVAGSDQLSRVTDRIPSSEHAFIKNRTRHYECEVRGLKPNTLYHFRLQTVGSKSASLLSPPLVLMTIPDQPSAPVLINVSSTRAHVKWYPGKDGCFKFRVECRIQAPLSASSSDASRLWGVWAAVSAGQETLWTPTTLSPNKKYEVRIVALNYLGQESQPSDSLIFKTKMRPGAEGGALEASIVSAPTDIDSTFPIDCTGDICIGDTILLTEYLYSTDRDRDNNKVCLGERTIAAIVYRDNYRTIRKASSSLVNKSSNSNILDSGAALLIEDKEDALVINGGKRKLGLEVVWERCSAACRPYANKPGEILERQCSIIEQFEVFRMRWTDEGGRRRLRDEWQLLAYCFHSPTSSTM